MKKELLFLLTAICATCSLFAVPASPEPFVYTQPDGSNLTLYLKGDEFYHWVETENKDIVIRNNGSYEYATIDNDQIVASGIVVSSKTPPATKSQLPTRNELIKLMLQKRSHTIAQIDSMSRLDDSNMRSIPLTEGNQKVLCILIGFPDKPFTKTQTDFSNLWNQIGYNYDGSQGSVKDFYLENSYGLLNVTATVVGPYVASHNSSYYDYHNGDYKALIKEAMQAAKNDVQFSDFDVNNNYFVDLVHVVFAGYGKESADSLGVIWSHRSTLSMPVWQGLYKAKDYICSSELAGYSGTKVAPIGTVCHEYGHDLGAPDYYDLVEDGNEFKGTGHWDVMCRGSWNNQGRCPAHHNPYTKAYIYNWTNPVTLPSYVSNGAITIYSSHTTSLSYRINTNTSGEFFMLENKKKLGFNSGIPGYNNDGLLIYHIHKDIESGINNHNVNSSHPQKCYIVNANATSNPNSSPSSYGTDDTQWAYPTNNQIFFTATSTPSATSWAGEATGIDLCFIRKEGNNIKLTINPAIIGLPVLDSIATYSISNIPPQAKIKWTYTANVVPSNSIIQGPFRPLIFVGGDSTASVIVRRGKYPTSVLPPIDTSIVPYPHIMQEPLSINSPTIDWIWKYYTGTITLNATISCGGDTLRLIKEITLPSTNTSKIQQRKDDNGIDKISSGLDTTEYHLAYPNPVTTNILPIYITKLSNGVLIPITETYTIELWDNKYGLVKRITDSSADISLELSLLPTGIYHLIFIVNGTIKTSNKIIKLQN